MNTLARSASEGNRLATSKTVALCSALALLAGCGPTDVANNNQPEVAEAGSALEVVMAGPPARKTLTLVSTQPARIEAIEQTPLHSKLAGYVAEVLVDYGDSVTAGQP